MEMLMIRFATQIKHQISVLEEETKKIEIEKNRIECMEKTISKCKNEPGSLRYIAVEDMKHILSHPRFKERKITISTYEKLLLQIKKSNLFKTIHREEESTIILEQILTEMEEICQEGKEDIEHKIEELDKKICIYKNFIKYFDGYRLCKEVNDIDTFQWILDDLRLSEKEKRHIIDYALRNNLHIYRERTTKEKKSVDKNVESIKRELEEQRKIVELATKVIENNIDSDMYQQIFTYSQSPSKTNKYRTSTVYEKMLPYYPKEIILEEMKHINEEYNQKKEAFWKAESQEKRALFEELKKQTEALFYIIQVYGQIVQKEGTGNSHVKCRNLQTAVMRK